MRISSIKYQIVLAVCAAAVGSAEAAPKAAPAAVLTEARGTVEVKRSGETAWTPLTYTTLLSPGDSVRAGKESGAALLYSDGRRDSLGAEATAEIRPSRAGETRAFTGLTKQLEGVLDPKATPLDLRGYQLRGYQLRGYQLRGDGMEPPLLAFSPRYSAAPESRPFFHWKAAPGAAALKLTVYDRSEKELWSTSLDSAASPRQYPANAPVLAPGEYLWEVIGKVNGQAELSSARFTVLSAAQAAKVRREVEAARAMAAKDETNLPLIGVYLEHRLYPEAEAELVKARQRSPGDRTLSLLLARVYSETRRTVPPGLLSGE